MKCQVFMFCMVLFLVLDISWAAKKKKTKQESSFSANIDSFFNGKSKTKTNSGSSYPKQTWSPSKEDTNVGLERNWGNNRDTGGGSSYNAPPGNKQWGYSDSNRGSSQGSNGPRGSSIFGHSQNNYKQKPFGGYSGSKGLAIGAGAGFIGGAVGGIAAVNMYHQYRQYQSMIECIKKSNCNQGGNGNDNILVEHEDCVGGCPFQAYCDIGICRCRKGYESKYGQCWKTIEEFNVRWNDWEVRMRPDFNPYKKCWRPRDCMNIDMNMMCQDEKCVCKDNMAWNDEVQECQIFVDVSCKGINLDGDDQTSNDEDNKDSNDELTDVSDLTIEEILDGSELLKIDLTSATKEDVRKSFCREIAKTANLYVPDSEKVFWKNIGYLIAIGVSAVVVLCVLGWIVFCVIRKCSKKVYVDDLQDIEMSKAPSEVTPFTLASSPPMFSIRDQNGFSSNETSNDEDSETSSDEDSETSSDEDNETSSDED